MPLPWEADAPGFGFGPTGRTWLPQPAQYGEYAVDRQCGIAGSTVELYRTLLALRREHRLGLGRLAWDDDRARPRVLAFTTSTPEHEPVSVLANFGRRPVRLPRGARVLAASAPLERTGSIGTDVTVWLAG